jgi:hypothetical protein
MTASCRSKHQALSLLIAHFLSNWCDVTRYIIGIWDIEVNRGFADQVTIVNSEG